MADVFARLFDGGSPTGGYTLDERLSTQSMLYEIALPATGVIVAALAGGPLEPWVENDYLNALHTVVNGEPHRTELELGHTDLAEQCAARAKAGIWAMYSVMRRSNAEWLLDILDTVDEDRERVAAFRHTYVKASRK